MPKCGQCGRRHNECTCARQSSLLEALEASEAMPAWQSELQQRIEAYHARRGRSTPASNSTPQVLTWRTPPPAPEAAAQPEPPTLGVTLLRPLSSALAVPAPVPQPKAAWPAVPAQRWHEPWDSGELLQLPLPIVAPRQEPAAALPPLASRALRAHAALLDGLIVLAGSGLFALTAWASRGFVPPGAHWLRASLPAWVGVPLVLAAVYLWLCARGGGATPGMHSLGLRIVSRDPAPGGGAPTAEALRRRAWASIASLGALGLGFFWMYCDPDGLTWHDVISGTCVVSASVPSPADADGYPLPPR